MGQPHGGGGQQLDPKVGFPGFVRALNPQTGEDPTENRLLLSRWAEYSGWSIVGCFGGRLPHRPGCQDGKGIVALSNGFPNCVPSGWRAGDSNLHQHVTVYVWSAVLPLQALSSAPMSAITEVEELAAEDFQRLSVERRQVAMAPAEMTRLASGDDLLGNVSVHIG